MFVYYYEHYIYLWVERLIEMDAGWQTFGTYVLPITDQYVNN